MHVIVVIVGAILQTYVNASRITWKTQQKVRLMQVFLFFPSNLLSDKSPYLETNGSFGPQRPIEFFLLLNYDYKSHRHTNKAVKKIKVSQKFFKTG